MNLLTGIPFIKPLLREVKFRFLRNQAEEMLKSEIEDVQQQWQEVIDNSQSYVHDLNQLPLNSKVLFVTGYGLGTHYLAIEPIIMMALYTRKCKIISLYCNKSLPACEFNAVGNNKPNSISDLKNGVTNKAICATCNKCVSNLKSTYGELPVEMHGYEEYLNDADYAVAYNISKEVEFKNFRDFVYNDIKIGEEAYSSILRVIFRGEVANNKLSQHLVQRYIMSGILTAIAYERAYKKINPDRIVCIHGVYQIHGLAVKVANKLGIPVIVIGGGGIRKDTVVVCHNETYHLQLVNEPNDKWQNFKLNDEERVKTLSYANKKKNSGNGADYLSYHPNPIEDVEALYEYCNIDKSRKIVSLYTNVIWDAQIFYDGNAFKDIFDWLSTSIKELGKNEHIWGIIRIHPAESKGGLPTKQPMLQEIKKMFPILPRNIRIIPPESDLSSYVLAQESIANIIYGTKMGLEIALMKRPLIICGETFSRNKGYGLDIISKDVYIELLKYIHLYKVNDDEKFEIALQYAHYFYFRKMINMPVSTFSSQNGNKKTLLFNHLKELSEGSNQGLDVICNGILEGSDFYIGATTRNAVVPNT